MIWAAALSPPKTDPIFPQTGAHRDYLDDHSFWSKEEARVNIFDHVPTSSSHRDLDSFATHRTEDSPQRVASLTRRHWLKRTLGVGAVSVAGIGLYASEIELHWVEIVRRDMPISGIPTALEGKTLVQISEVHIGDRVDNAFLIGWSKRVAQGDPTLSSSPVIS